MSHSRLCLHYCRNSLSHRNLIIAVLVKEFSSFFFKLKVDNCVDRKVSLVTLMSATDPICILPYILVFFGCYKDYN